jgi:hypothetical protein
MATQQPNSSRDDETAAALTLAARDFRMSEGAYRQQAMQRQASYPGNEDDKLRNNLFQGGYIAGEKIFRGPTLSLSDD